MNRITFLIGLSILPLHGQDPNQLPAAQKNSPIPVLVMDAQGERIKTSIGEFDLNDNRFAEHFRGYLVIPTNQQHEAEVYAETLTKIRVLLGPDSKFSRRSKLLQVDKLLVKAAGFSGDNEISHSLRNAIAMATLSLTGNSNSQQDIAKMRKEHKALITRLDMLETRTNLDPARAPGKAGSNRAGAKNNNLDTVRGLEMTRQSLELLKKMKLAEVQMGTSTVFAKTQFQAFLMQLYMQRRFDHCLIGCHLYNTLFNDGGNELSIDPSSSLGKIFSDQLGVQPTVAGLGSLCNETIGKINDLIGYAEGHLANDELNNASKRLAEAYFGGEHLSAIYQVSSSHKNRISRYIRDSMNLKDAVKHHNWTLAKTYAEALKAQATDFRYIQAETAIEGFKTASNAKLAQYYAASSQREHAKAAEHLTEAHTLWPNNPDINKEQKRKFEEIRGELAQSKLLEVKSQEFRAMLQTNDFDSLSVSKAAEYKQWFKSASINPDLSPELQQEYSSLHQSAGKVVDQLMSINEAILKAEFLSKNLAHESAWETMALEHEKETIAKRTTYEAMNRFSEKASSFRDLLNQADKHLEAENYGSAFSCYLKAKTQFPKSIMAKRGIDHLVNIQQGEL